MDHRDNPVRAPPCPIRIWHEARTVFQQIELISCYGLMWADKNSCQRLKNSL
jgi:hypothetical protein